MAMWFGRGGWWQLQGARCGGRMDVRVDVICGRVDVCGAVAGQFRGLSFTVDTASPDQLWPAVL